jgi:hypothetical protein
MSFAKCGAKRRTKAQNNDLRRYLVIYIRVMYQPVE